MKEVSGKRVIREYRTRLMTQPQQIFPLLCPVREYDWIPQWRCEMLYTQSGVAELGCVFQTDFGDKFGPEIWVVSHYQPDRKIAFVRTGSVRTTRYEVILIPDDGATIIEWRQEITGLTPAGNVVVAEYSNEEFTTMMVSLNTMLAHYLEVAENDKDLKTKGTSLSAS
jgi:hypothetical protein